MTLTDISAHRPVGPTPRQIYRGLPIGTAQPVDNCGAPSTTSSPRTRSRRISTADATSSGALALSTNSLQSHSVVIAVGGSGGSMLRPSATVLDALPEADTALARSCRDGCAKRGSMPCRTAAAARSRILPASGYEKPSPRAACAGGVPHDGKTILDAAYRRKAGAPLPYSDDRHGTQPRGSCTAVSTAAST